MWDDARTYDLVTGGFAGDITFWNGLIAETKPRRILDLACGTGRMTLPLAEAARAQRDDAQVVGLDLSSTFVKRARERVTNAGLSRQVEIVEGDMRTFAFDEPFDLIILGYNSLSYLHTIEDHCLLLSTVRRHLTPNGVFGIDNQAPYLAHLAEAGSATFPIVRRELDRVQPAPGIARFSSFFVSTRYDAATQTEYSTHYWEIYHEDGQRETHIKDLTWHHYFPHELELLLRQNELTPIARYGDYDRTPFGSSSSIYLWVIQPLPTATT